MLRSLIAISDNFTGSAVPEHEADRRTFLVGAARRRRHGPRRLVRAAR